MSKSIIRSSPKNNSGSSMPFSNRPALSRFHLMKEMARRDFYEGRLLNLIINVPPGHAKSLLTAVFWPAWWWIHAPETRFLFASYSASISVRDSVRCRRLVESEWYQQRWGRLYQLTEDQNQKQRFENNRTGYRIATSVGGSATGERADVVVVDDPHSVEQAASDVERRAAIEWWNGTMSTRLNNFQTGHKVVIQQRLHEADLSGDLLQKGGYELLCLPAEYEPERKCTTSIGWTDPRQKEGELLWQERVTRRDLEALKISLGSYRYAGQYQQRPSPAEGGIFKRAWFGYWRPAHLDVPPVQLRSAVRAGATDFLTKPVDDETLLRAIRRCFSSDVEEQVRTGQGGANNGRFDHKQRLKAEKPDLEDELRSELGFEEIVGRSEALHRVLEQVRVVAPTDCTVLICGETGTGKELIARAVHNRSARNPGPFVKVNCAAIPDSLLESEMFGHEKGSFTGAVAQRVGRFEMAHHGTLFLDEIGEMPLELQPKLLRAIQDLEFERVGGSRTIRTDARFVVATNRDLKTMVEQKKFRADLYYRLNVFPLHVPPLRERREDIPVLTRYFVQKHAQRMGRGIDTIPDTVLEALTNYDWPGNIRELQNVLERSVILTTGHVLQVPALETMGTARPVTFQAASQPGSPSAERARILRALEQARGQIGGPDGAAALLGLKRTTLQSRMRKHNISRQFC